MPAPTDLLADPLWRELLQTGRLLERSEGELAGRPFRELVAAPSAYRGVFLGYVALIDKEERGGEGSSFSADDRRFLDSVAALAGVALDAARQVERLETQREQLAEENKALQAAACSTKWRAAASSPTRAPMRRALEMVERVAPRGVSVLLRGESGTGKELVAKLIHLLSGRSGPLVALNCAALPESLLESELFGIEGGVATGVQARRGKFELAARRDALPRRDRRHGAASSRPSCCAPCRSARSCASGASGRSRSTCAWWRRRTAIWKLWSPTAVSARTSTTD